MIAIKYFDDCTDTTRLPNCPDFSGDGPAETEPRATAQLLKPGERAIAEYIRIWTMAASFPDELDAAQPKVVPFATCFAYK
jgi:hypothetical protein